MKIYNGTLVSIIVPVYNIEKYLPKCIESICAQTYRNLEIILVDDGSKDSCPQICDEYALKDSRVCVIHKKNAGLISARKTGIKRAKGEFVLFVDGDDWVSAEMTGAMLGIILEQQADCVVCGFYRAGETAYAEKQYLPAGYYSGKKYETCFLPKMLQTGGGFPFWSDAVFMGENVSDRENKRKCFSCP